MDWKGWLKTVLSAVIGGGVTGLAQVLTSEVSSGTFDPKKATIAAAAGAAVAVAHLFVESPVKKGQ